MKNKRKIFAPLIAVIMIFIFSLTAFAENITDIQSDTTVTVNEETDYYRFVPEVSADYIFASSTDADVAIAIYDSEYNYMDSHDDIDTMENNFNFYLKTYLEAGKTYFIEITNYSFGETHGEIIFTVETGCMHLNTTDYPAIDATCTVNGYTAGKYCNDCEEWLEGHEEIKASHTDDNGDRYCEVCFEEAIDTEGVFNEKGTTLFRLYVNGDLIIYGDGEVIYWESELWVSHPDTKIKNVYIGEGISSIISLPHDETIEKYIVDENNDYYKSDEYGVLFTKDGTQLLFYPDSAPYTSYVIPDGTQRIENYAFEVAVNLEEISVPDTIQYISADSFNEKILEKAYWENGVCYLDDMVIKTNFLPTNYEDADKNNHISIKEGTRVICSEAVRSYYNEAYLSIPESVKVICDSALRIRVSTIHIPKNVLYFGVDNKDNYYLEKITVDANNPYYTTDNRGVLFNKDMTTLVVAPSRLFSSYTVPATVKEINEYAFSSPYISQVILHEGITEIKPYTFASSGINSITFPSSVKKIGHHAFYNSSLVAAVIPTTVEKVETFAFSGAEALFFMNPDCEIEDNAAEYDTFICSYKGSTAESYALEHNPEVFIPFGEGHKHLYIPFDKTVSDCTQGGERIYYCPCGEGETYTETFEPDDHDYDENLVNYETGETTCIFCGIEFNIYGDCDCRCHEQNRHNFIDEIIYKFMSIIWKFFGLKEECECGKLHY